MERVMIIGCGGAGKSTLARKRGEKTGLPVVHLDQIWWAPKSQGLLTIQTCHPSVADRDSSPQGEPFAGNEMTPDHIGQGSFLFLGFNHWVTSLSAGSTGRFMFGWNPSAAFMFFSFRMRLALM